MIGSRLSKLLKRGISIQSLLKYLCDTTRTYRAFTKITSSPPVMIPVEAYGSMVLQALGKATTRELTMATTYMLRHRTNGGMDTKDKRLSYLMIWTLTV